MGAVELAPASTSTIPDPSIPSIHPSMDGSIDHCFIISQLLSPNTQERACFPANPSCNRWRPYNPSHTRLLWLILTTFRATSPSDSRQMSQADPLRFSVAFFFFPFFLPFFLNRHETFPLPPPTPNNSCKPLSVCSRSIAGRAGLREVHHHYCSTFFALRMGLMATVNSPTRW